MGQEVGPEVATGQGQAGAPVWLDPLESLPTAADPEALLDKVDPEADPRVASNAGPGVQEASVLEAVLHHETGILDLEKVGPSAGALAGEVEDLRAQGERLEPLAQRVSPDVHADPQDVDVEEDYEASLPDTWSVSGSCSTGGHGAVEESLAWGKKEEYFQVSISEVELGGPKRADEVLASEQHHMLESVESELLSSPCMSFTGPNSDMQMVPRRQQRDPVLREATPEGFAVGGMAELELQ
jgi:hypothetical protein